MKSLVRTGLLGIVSNILLPENNYGLELFRSDEIWKKNSTVIISRVKRRGDNALVVRKEGRKREREHATVFSTPW